MVNYVNTIVGDFPIFLWFEWTSGRFVLGRFPYTIFWWLCLPSYYMTQVWPNYQVTTITYTYNTCFWINYKLQPVPTWFTAWFPPFHLGTHLLQIKNVLKLGKCEMNKFSLQGWTLDRRPTLLRWRLFRIRNLGIYFRDKRIAWIAQRVTAYRSTLDLLLRMLRV